VYLCDNCNNAGFVEIDVEGWCPSIACSEKDLQKAWEGLIRGFIIADGWAFIRNYLKHQKHIPLDPVRNPAHKQIAGMFRDQERRFPGLLERLIEGQSIEAPTEGLASPLGIGKGEGEGKGVGNGEGKPDEPEPPKPKSFKQWTRDDLTASVQSANADDLLLPEEVDDFIEYWTEPTASGRFRLTLEKTWDTRRRMQNAVRMVYEQRRAGGNTGAVSGKYADRPLTANDIRLKIEAATDELHNMPSYDEDRTNAQKKRASELRAWIKELRAKQVGI
jgi:hypothetical protein